MKERHHQRRVREIFGRAHELEGDARQEFLDRVCGDDAALRAEVDSLLAALDQAKVGDPASAAKARDETVDPEQPGTVLGAYKLLQRIGEGGMGSVFLAEQLEPVKRRVALKIVRGGLDSKQVAARFEAERQALALMDHPNIARVLDAGATENGRPFFVMELVKGVPITQFCDEHNLTIEERLELFVPVCQAVQHAHQKGVIHRDIKPSNVLVMESDGRAIPKVIDFGIAKATTTQLTEKTLFTEFRALLGTPEYMSPEQAQGNLDIDTRADVYGLGVLLYELLVGVTPFDPSRLRAAGMLEVLRILKEVEPPRPSTRVSTETSSAIAAARRTAPRRLGTLMRGELDWMVMKCLEKDRARRYETANALALDIGRYLNNEPILAGPPRAIYRTRKFVRRNRGVVAAAAAIVVALVGGTIGTGYGLVEAKHEARKARDAVDEQKRLAGVAETKRQEADAERRKAEDLQRLADRRTEDVKRQLYATRIRLAMVAWNERDPERAKALLNETEPEQRGWEWKYLNWLQDRSSRSRQVVVPLPGIPDDRSTPSAHATDWSRIAYADGDGTVVVMTTEPLRRLCEFRAYSKGVRAGISTVEQKVMRGPVSALQFTPDGTRLLTSGNAGLPGKVFDATTGAHICTLQDSAGIFKGSMDPAGTLLISGRPWVWNLKTGRRLCRLETPPEPVRPGAANLALSRDGTRVFGVATDSIYLWQSDTGALLGRLDIKGFRVHGMVAGPDSHTLVVTGEDATEDEEVVRVIQERDRSGIYSRVYDYREQRLLRRLDLGFVSLFGGILPTDNITAFSPDGRYVATPREGHIEVTDFETGKLVRTYAGRVRVADSLRFSADGMSFYTENWRGDLSRESGRDLILTRTEYDFTTPEETFTIHSAVRGDGMLRFVAGGAQLRVMRPIFGTSPRPSVTYDVRSGREHSVVSDARGVSVSREGRRLAEVMGQKPSDWQVALVKVTDAVTGEEIRTIEAPGGRITAVDLDPDGTRLAVATGVTRPGTAVQESTTRIFDVASGRPLATLHGNRTHVYRLQFSPGGRTLVANDSYEDLCVWDTRTYKRILRRTRTGYHAFSPDSRKILVADSRGGLILDAETGRELGRLTSWRRGRAAAFHPDGRRLVTATFDALTVWDLSTGAELLTLHTRKRGFSGLAFDEAGERLAALTEDGDIAIFECAESDADVRRARYETGIRQRARKLVRDLHWVGVVGDDLRRRLDKLERERREDAAVLARARELAGRPDLLVARDLNGLIRALTKQMGDRVVANKLRGAEAMVQLAPGNRAILNTLGVVLYRAGEYERALETLRESDRMYSEQHGRISVTDAAFLAMTLHQLGRKEAARAQLVRAASGPAFPQSDSDRAFYEAENLIAGSGFPPPSQRARGLAAWTTRTQFREELYGRVHRRTAQAHYVRASYQRGTGDLAAAERACREALRIRLELEPDTVPSEVFDSLLRTLRLRRRLDQAETLYQEMLAVIRKGHGKDSLHEADLLGRMARHLRIASDLDKAVVASEREVGIRRRHFPSGKHLHDSKLPTALLDYALALGTVDRHREAEAAAREALKICRMLYGEYEATGARAQRDIGIELRGQDKNEQAEPFLDAAIETMRSMARPPEKQLATALLHRAQCHTAKREWEAAAELYRECMELRKKVYREDSWYIYNAMSCLGDVQAKLAKFEIAEPMLIEAAEKIRPPERWLARRRDALQRVIEMYEAWEEKEPGKGYAEKAAEWKKKAAAERR